MRVAMTRQFDTIVIGAGQAGPPLANRLTGAGLTVALVERDQFGGTCVNTGCMPTKTLVASAYAAHLARRGGDYGVVLDAPVRLNMGRIKQRAATDGVERWLGPCALRGTGYHSG
jgi:pyruvate/2-oxoglutarate dehydrogenase complex dihydrolipoamide dehydrogenase (E3) component